MVPNLTNLDWRFIAKLASTEQDHAKLRSLVAWWCRSLDQRGSPVTHFPCIANTLTGENGEEMQN
jgi:hypothetical protein